MAEAVREGTLSSWREDVKGERIQRGPTGTRDLSPDQVQTREIPSPSHELFTGNINVSSVSRIGTNKASCDQESSEVSSQDPVKYQELSGDLREQVSSDEVECHNRKREMSSRRAMNLTRGEEKSGVQGEEATSN